MVENVSPLGPVKGPSAPLSAGRAEGIEGERSFKDILEESIRSVDQLQKDADVVYEKFSKGEADSADVNIAFKKAQIAFEALMQIRNKLVDAFNEVQRMRI